MDSELIPGWASWLQQTAFEVVHLSRGVDEWRLTAPIPSALGNGIDLPGDIPRNPRTVPLKSLLRLFGADGPGQPLALFSKDLYAQLDALAADGARRWAGDDPLNLAFGLAAERAAQLRFTAFEVSRAEHDRP